MSDSGVEVPGRRIDGIEDMSEEEIKYLSTLGLRVMRKKARTL